MDDSQLYYEMVKDIQDKYARKREDLELQLWRDMSEVINSFIRGPKGIFKKQQCKACNLLGEPYWLYDESTTPDEWYCSGHVPPTYCQECHHYNCQCVELRNLERR